MARPIDEFVLAWGALSGGSKSSGWRSIPVASAGPCPLMAARHFPGNEESLLAGFGGASLPTSEKLPEGHGFEVARADPHGDGKTWIALNRTESGSIELFAEMVGDVAGAMDAAGSSGEDAVLRAMLGRVRAWQEFMRKGVQPLSPESELGLIGELAVMEGLLEAGASPFSAVEAWVGPLGGLQDFSFGDGAIEVKATLFEKGFPAKIGSLEQLDDSSVSPLFIAGLRFSLHETGRSLPEIAASLSERFRGFQEVKQVYLDRLLAAGYHVLHAGRYGRRFSLEGIRVLEVTSDFPRILKGDVADAVIRVKYDIDIDRIQGHDFGLRSALGKLGVV